MAVGEADVAVQLHRGDKVVLGWKTACGECEQCRADALYRARALVPEQQRQRVPPAVLLDRMQVAVADARGVDSQPHLARPGLVDEDLLQRHLARRGEDYTLVSHERSRSRIE